MLSRHHYNPFLEYDHHSIPTQHYGLVAPLENDRDPWSHGHLRQRVWHLHEGIILGSEDSPFLDFPLLCPELGGIDHFASRVEPPSIAVADNQVRINGFQKAN